MRRGGTSRLLLITIRSSSDLGLARFAHDAPRPDLVIADPTALDQVDGASLARSGMETLVHAVEAFANPGYHPPADALALDAVRRLAIWLPAAVRPRLDREARREALAGALNAGLGMEKGVGGVDAVAHRLERRVAGDGRGGLLHAPLMAALVPFNMPAVGERYGALAGAMGAASGGAAALAERLRASPPPWACPQRSGMAALTGPGSMRWRKRQRTIPRRPPTRAACQPATTTVCWRPHGEGQCDRRNRRVAKAAGRIVSRETARTSLRRGGL